MTTKLLVVLILLAFLCMASECDGGVDPTPQHVKATIEIVCPDSHTVDYKCLLVTPEP